MNKNQLFVAIVCMAVTFSVAQKKSYSVDVRPIFLNYGCLTCHGGSNNLFLGTYAQVFSTGNHKPVIKANDTNSVLILKIKGTAGFGDQMPQGAPVMAAADLNKIIQWVKDGALENPTSVFSTTNNAEIKTFELRQNYPNPFNPTTKIQFSVPVSGPVKLSLHDAVGKEIMLLVDQNMEAGMYSYHLSALNLASGVYFYRLQSSNNILTKKLTLIK